jgi:FG-GAP repeat
VLQQDPIDCLFPDGTWRQMGTDIKGEAAGDQSGYSIAMSADGKTIAIGAINNDGMSRSNSGHVRVYSFNTSTLRNNWVQIGAD